MIDIFAGALVVFAITLTVNKSKLFHHKREFVKQRYKAAKTNGQNPGFIHGIWHAWWTCEMCFGFWVSLLVGMWFSTSYGYIWTVLMLYGLNWLLHCLEEYLVNQSKQDNIRLPRH